MVKQIGAVIGPDAAPRPRREPVRRHSRLVGRCEGTFWAPAARQELRRIVLAARRFDFLNRRRGHRNGPLGHVALEVLDLLANLVNRRTGRLDPALDYLMGALRRSRDAIVRALRALRDHGFLDWLRRYVPTGVGPGERGPRVKQASNAYRISLPRRAAALLGRYGRPAPIPDDLDAEREGREAEHRDMLESLPLAELPGARVEDSTLAQALALFGHRVSERESARRSESQSKDSSCM